MSHLSVTCGLSLSRILIFSWLAFAANLLPGLASSSPKPYASMDAAHALQSNQISRGDVDGHNMSCEPANEASDVRQNRWFSPFAMQGTASITAIVINQSTFRRMSKQPAAPETTVAGLPADFQTLQQVELDVLKSLDIAASAVEELAKVDGADKATLEQQVTDFLDTVKARTGWAAHTQRGAQLHYLCTAAAEDVVLTRFVGPSDPADRALQYLIHTVVW